MTAPLVTGVREMGWTGQETLPRVVPRYRRLGPATGTRGGDNDLISSTAFSKQSTTLTLGGLELQVVWNPHK